MSQPRILVTSAAGNTVGTNPEEIKRRKDHVLLNSPVLVRDSQSWLDSHDPAAGFVPDRPSNTDLVASLAG